MQVKRIKRVVNGVLLLDKPYGFSSNQALQKVKWLYQAQKAGHTGTLDPLATGVLPLCFGEATKFAQRLTDENKTYQATLKFGVTTTTGDKEGDIVSVVQGQVTAAQIAAVLPSFMGRITQVPPMYSALKVNGKPLYEYAREGQALARQPREVTIYALTLLRCVDNEADIAVTCSKGTYIRTLVDDLGELLGCGAHVSRLHRVQVGPFQAAQMVTPQQLEALNEQQDWAALDALLLPMDAGLQGLPSQVGCCAAKSHYAWPKLSGGCGGCRSSETLCRIRPVIGYW